MAQAESWGLEVRYCEFEDGVYSAQYASHQVDSHGGEGGSASACKHILVHYNSFSLNETNERKPNVCFRGNPTYGAEVHHNWTKKLHDGKAGAYSTTYADDAFQLWGAATGTLASHNVSVHDNWYGPSAPPGGTPTTPLTDFVANVTSGVAPLAVTFTDLSTQSPTAWAWSFGDGGTSSSQSPSHTYASAGVYTVALTSQTSAGSNTETKTSYITVTSESGTLAAFAADPTSGDRPLTVKFTNLSQNADSYSWSFGDGGASLDTAPTHTYTKVGAFDVSLTASASSAGTSGDVGGEATGARGFASGTSGYTQIFLDNPLNSAVDISQIDFDIDTAVTGAKVGLFYGSGSSYTCRDMVEIGAIGTGTVNKTLDAGNNPIALEGAIGDYMGWYCASGKIMCDHTGGSGVYYKSGDHVNTSEAISGMTLLADYVYSLYGTGSSTGASTSDTETKTSYITVTGNTAPSASFKVRVMLTPKTKLTIAGNQVSHMLANSKAGAW
jgi:PKD repeat protein